MKRQSYETKETLRKNFLNANTTKMETASNAEMAKRCQMQMERVFHLCIHGFSLLQLVEICS